MKLANSVTYHLFEKRIFDDQKMVQLLCLDENFDYA